MIVRGTPLPEQAMINLTRITGIMQMSERCMCNGSGSRRSDGPYVSVLNFVFGDLIFCGSLSQFGGEISLPSLAAGSPFVDVAEASAHRVPV